MIPNDRKYAKTHEWVKIEGDVAVVGISDHAQDSLGDITFVELPAISKKVEQSKECCVIESVKAASDIYAPLSGSIVEVNKAIESEPEKVNESPLEDGWLFKIGNISLDEMNNLMNAELYKKFLEESE